MEDEPRQISASGGTDLYEAGSMMDRFLDRIHRIREYVMPWIYAVLIVAVTVLILSTAIGIQP